mmetsp:Transcript_31597/g.48307  ORF Transcript_31597/g.48307 Transcript_31597/m.48307 type:complete len:236 (-) Transcript_31597:967-1674(-)
MSHLKSMKLSEDELGFLKEYRRLEDLEREKGIKFFECVGDPPATDEFKDSVADKRDQLVQKGLDTMRMEDIHRFAVEVNKDKVVIPTTVNIQARPKWDVYQNNHFAMRKRLVGIFLKVANKQIIRMRAGKRLQAIKRRFQEMKISSREDCKKMVAEDWKLSLNVRQGVSEEETENIQNVAFKFSFKKKEIQSDIKLPLEYETNIASFMEKIDAQPVINFDDLEVFDPIEQLDFET